MNIKGKLVEIFETQLVKDTFRKREFVVEYRENAQFAEFLKFEMVQDKCDLLNGFKPGQEVDVQFNLKGRIWVNAQGEKVYFNSLQAWRIESADQSQAPVQDRGKKDIAQNMSPDLSGGVDDLPF